MNPLPQFVTKKNGNVARFRVSKLSSSLESAFRHVEGVGHAEVGPVLREVLSALAASGRHTVTVDMIRGATVNALHRAGLRTIANAYDLTFLRLRQGTLTHVTKRNGTLQEFHPYKIFKAIRKSLTEARMPDPVKAELLTKEAIHALEVRFRETRLPPTTHEIRRAVADTLRVHKLEQARTAYLLHRYA